MTTELECFFEKALQSIDGLEQWSEVDDPCVAETALMAVAANSSSTCDCSLGSRLFRFIAPEIFERAITFFRTTFES